jgi:hypothetical protein
MGFLSPREKPSAPNQGDSFHRPTRFDGLETAEIISVGPDTLGIPHVRFNVRISNPVMVIEETRTLALESFLILYQGSGRIRT